MAKNSDKQGVSDPIQTAIEVYSVQLQSYIDHARLRDACRTSTRSLRLYMYESILRDACRQCFRSTNVIERGSSYGCDVWGHDGRLWVKLPSVVFADAVGRALIAVADAGSLVVTEDWVSKKAVMLNDAYSGVCTNRLEPNASVIGFRNGVWDFSDIEHPRNIPFKERPCVTELLPYDYDPDASCPLWCGFLNMMLSKGDVVRLQKYLGLGVVRRDLTGHSVEDTLWLVGSGANGKSTILDIVRSVYGYGNTSVTSMRELLDRVPDNRMRAIAEIDGKIFNICSEVDMADMARESESFKRLCSGEAHNARRLGRDIYRAEHIPYLIFSMNQRPSNKRMDAAFRRRLVEVVFKVSVRPEDMDANLGEKLKGELSGIRNWMIEGYRRLMADGFLFDHTGDEEYMEENGQYFDIFVRHEGLRPDAWAGHDEKPHLVSANILLEKFQEFCRVKMMCADQPSAKSMAADLKRLRFRKAPRKAAGVFYEVYSDRELDYSVR